MQRFTKMQHKGLTSGIGTHVRDWLKCRERCNVQDPTPASLQHLRQHKIREFDQGGHVEANHCQNPSHIRVVHLAHNSKSGIVDQQRDRLALSRNLCQYPLRLPGTRQVRRDH